MAVKCSSAQVAARVSMRGLRVRLFELLAALLEDPVDVEPERSNPVVEGVVRLSVRGLLGEKARDLVPQRGGWARFR